jgi:hypothetical protein
MSAEQAADALRSKAVDTMTGYRVQFGRWTDGLPTDKFTVIRMDGGGQNELVRLPRFSVMILGPQNGNALTTLADVEKLIASITQDSGGLVFMQPDEPVFYSTSEGRPVYELMVSTITSL